MEFGAPLFVVGACYITEDQELACLWWGAGHGSKPDDLPLKTLF